MAEPVIHLYPADSSACGTIRLTLPAEALKAQGAQIHVETPLSGEGLIMQVGRRGGQQYISSIERPDCDVIVLQRPLRDILADAIPLLQAHGCKVVVEIDDDFESVHRQHAAWELVQPKFSPDNNRQHLVRACALADFVVASTPAIAQRYGTPGKVAVVRNRIPARYLNVTVPHDEGVVVGWTGQVASHPTDLDVVGHRFGRMLHQTGARFRVVGSAEQVKSKLRLWDEPEETGFVALEEYPVHYAMLDVAIAPLDQIAFNRSKSSLKMLEASALGVACVASPTDEYRLAAAQGMGLLASNPKDWERRVGQLVREPEYRADVAGLARDVARDHTIEAHCSEWWDAWTAPLRARVAVA